MKELKVEIDDDLVDYIEMKQQLLLSYCLNVVYYLSLKVSQHLPSSPPFHDVI